MYSPKFDATKGQFRINDTNGPLYAGTITVTSQSRIEILLQDVPIQIPFSDSHKLFGEVEQGIRVSVLSAKITNRQNLHNERKYSYKFVAFEVIEGNEFFQEEQQVSELSFETEYLTQWFDDSELTIEDSRKLQEERPDKLLLGSDRFKLYERFVLDAEEYNYPYNGWKVLDRRHLVIQSPKLTYQEYLEYFRQLVRFVAFAVRSPVTWKEVFFRTATGRFRLHKYSLKLPSENEEFLRIRALISYRKNQNIISSIISRWFKLYELCGSSLDTHIGISYNENLYWSNIFQMHIQATEGLHRATIASKKFPEKDFTAIKNSILCNIPAEHKEWIGNLISNEPSLKARIDEIITRLGIADLTWYKEHYSTLKTSDIRQTRVAFAHGLEHDLNAQSVSFQSSFLEKLCQTLILNFLGLPYPKEPLF